MTYKPKATVCSEIRTKHSMQSEHHVNFLKLSLVVRKETARLNRLNKYIAFSNNNLTYIWEMYQWDIRHYCSYGKWDGVYWRSLDCQERSQQCLEVTWLDYVAKISYLQFKWASIVHRQAIPQHSPVENNNPISTQQKLIIISHFQI
jgi:hypothetical protein